MLEGRPTRAAFLAAAGCCGLYIALYSGSNALAASRGDAGTLYLPGELDIPLVPWAIVPYLSIDLLFALAPFACASVEQIRVLVRRLVAALFVAVPIFVLWPLRLGFERTEVEGVFGPLFDLVHAVDPPHNLCPSLHVAQIAILAVTFHGRVPRVWRWPMHGWFALAIASTVLTHQHHLADVAAGALLAVLILCVIRSGGARPGSVTAPSAGSSSLL